MKIKSRGKRDFFRIFDLNRIFKKCSKRIIRLFPSITAALCLSFALSLFINSAFASPVDEKTAKSAALGWLIHTGDKGLSAKLSRNIDSIDSFKDDNGETIYYVVNLKPEGYIVVSPDDQIEPIISFSQEGRLDPNPENPLYILLGKDMKDRKDYVKKELPAALKKAQNQNKAIKPDGVAHAEKSQEKWNLFLSKQIASASSPIIPDDPALSSINDLRVDKLVQSRWDQSTAGGNNCYNYYTPNNYVCGCVATAMSQLMRFHQYPTIGIGKRVFSVKVNGSAQDLFTRGGDSAGGAYDWNIMPLIPASGASDTERRMIGSLCYDAGLSVHMSYSAGSSGAYGFNVAPALKSVFKYANAIYGGAPYGNPMPSADIYNMTNTNLDAGYPVIFSIYGSGAHEIVCDGYGFNSSTPYHHLNMGWSGAYDQWYNLPTILTYYNYNSVYECTYNIFPSRGGEIISGRVLDESGTPVSGVIVETGIYSDVTDSKGIYALKHIMPGTHTITTAKSGYIPASLTKTIVQSVDGGQTGNIWGADITIIVGSTIPTVTSDSIDSITDTTVTISGQVRYDNGATVTDRGFCWDISQNPVITGNVLPVGNGTGKFSGTITGLTKNTIYYVRAYATNSYGTSYGKNLIFVAADMPKMVLYGMGLNNYGQLGDGTTNNQINPESLGFYTVNAISAGGSSHSLFIENGALYAMGWNGYGQLGDGTTNDLVSPKQIVSSEVKKVASGNYHSLFLKNDGTVWAMGWNGYGQLGDGTNTDRHFPTQITAIDNIVDIAASPYNSYFLKSDGTLFGVGWNGYGQLGDGTTTDQSSPITIASDVNTVVQSVAAGVGYTLFIKNDGSLWGMGCNANGQLGLGNSDKLVPTQIISAGSTTVTAVSAGNHSLFLKSDGSLWGMGLNENGQLGLGNKITQYSPQPIVQPMLGDPLVTSISAAGGTGGKHSLFLMNDGSLWGMGYNGNGQLGDGTTDDKKYPMQIVSSGVTAISAGSHSLFLKNRALFNLTFVGDGNGTVTPSKDTNQLVLQGGDANPVTAVPGTGYHFTNWTGTGDFQMKTDNPLTVATILSDMTVTANFAINDVQIITDVASFSVNETQTNTFKVKLTAQPTTDKTVTVTRTAGDTDVSVSSGSPLTFTPLNWDTDQIVTIATAKDSDLLNDSATLTVSSSGSTDKTISVTVVDTDTTLSIRANSKGTTTPSGTVNITKNAPQALTATPVTGYHFVNWTVLSGSATFGDVNSANTTVTISAPAAITPNFAINTYTVNFLNDGNGTISGTASQTVNHGSNCTSITAVPNANYNFVNWTGAVTSTSNPLTINNVTSDMDITANFAHDKTNLTMAATTGGTTTPAAGITTPVDTFTPTTIQANASLGYSFAGWSATGSAVVLNADSPNTTVTLSGNGAVKAHFIYGTVNPVTDNVPVGPLSAAQGGANVFMITVPASTTSLNIVASGGTGDYDIYAKLGSAPTTLEYNDKATGPGPGETLIINSPAAGTWYIMLYGYETYSGVTLLVTLGTGGPEKVTGLTVAAPAKADRVSLSWVVVPGAASYEVWRSDVNNVELASKINASDVLTNAYDDVFTLAGSYRFYYWVRAVNASGTGEFSSSVFGTNTAATIINLISGTAVTGISGNAGTVKTYRLTVPDALQTLLEVTVSGSIGDCDIDIVKPDSTLIRRSVRGTSNEFVQMQGAIVQGAWLINLYGQTNYSGLSLMAKYGKSIPAAPAGLAASDGLFADRVLLNWTASAGATAYEVWRGLKPTATDPLGPAAKIGETSDNTYDDNDPTLAPLVTYYYFVSAKNASGSSLLSANNSGYLMRAPLVIGSVTASAATYFDKILVTWPKVADAKYYEIFRSPATPAKTITGAVSIANTCVIVALGHGFSTNDTVLINGIVGTMSTLLNGKYFTVTKIDGNTFSIPVIVTGKTYTSGGAAMAVPATPLAEIPYDSLLTTYSFGDSADIADVNPVPGTTYNYWVRAVNANGAGPLKMSTAAGTVKSTAPTGVTASSGTYTGKVKIAWTAIPGATGYNVYRKSTVATITAATADNPCVITAAAHGFSTGDKALINGVVGTMSTLLNAKTLVIAKIDDNSFSVAVDTTGKTYTSGGTATVAPVAPNPRAPSLIAPAVNDISYFDTTAVPNVTYAYWVDADFNGLYQSALSTSSSGKIATAAITTLAAPVMKSVSKGEGSSIRVVWGEVPLAVTYNVYRKINAADPWGAPLKTEVTDLWFTDTPGDTRTYMYCIQAVNGIKTSTLPLSGMTGYAAPDLTANILGNSFTSPALNGGLGNQKFFQVTLPAGITRLVVNADQVSGDCDIYAKLGMYPTTTSYNAKGTAVGTTKNRILTVTNPLQGVWYILLQGSGKTGYTYADLSISYYTSTDIIITQSPSNDLAVPFTANFKGRVVDETGTTGIAGLSLQVRNPITGIISLLPAKTDASGYFTYSALINTEGEHTFDFFFNTIPDNAKGTASHTVTTRKGCLESNNFFDYSAYLPATPISVPLQTDVIGLQTYLDIRNGWSEGGVDAKYEELWINSTLVAASTDAALLGKLDEGLYMFFYGIEGAGVGNDTTANSALSAIPFVVHVDSSKLETVVTNLYTLGILDDTQKNAVLISKRIGVVTVAAFSNPGEGAIDWDKITSLLGREQLEVLANLAAGTASENLLAPEGNKYSDVITKKFSVDLNRATKKLNVKTSAFVK